MLIAAGMLMVLIVFALVGYPLFCPEAANAGFGHSLVNGTAGGTRPDGTDGDEGLEKARVALNDLEFDYRLKKISREDYEELKTELMQLVQADQDPAVQGGSGKDVAALLEADIADLSSGQDAAVASFCPACGASLLSSEQVFCHKCGKSISS